MFQRDLQDAAGRFQHKLNGALRLSEQNSIVMEMGSLEHKHTCGGEIEAWSEDMMPFQFDSSVRCVDDVKGGGLLLDLVREAADQTQKDLHNEKRKISVIDGKQHGKMRECLESGGLTLCKTSR